MSVTLTGTGGLFTRFGKIASLVRTLNGVRGESAAVGALNTGYVNYVDVATATTTGKATQVDLDGVAEPFTVVGIVQPDVPRNIRLTFTDGDASIDAYSVTVSGTGPDGEAATETFTFADGLTPSGVKIFAHISGIELTSINGNGTGDLLDVGHGVKMGVPTPNDSTGLTITELLVDGVGESPSATDTTNRSFTPTTAANGSRDYRVTYTWTNTDAKWGSTSGPKIKDSATGFNEIEAQFASTLQSLMDGLYGVRNTLRTSLSGTLTSLRSLAQTALIEQVHADAVLPKKDLTTALTELIRQMAVSVDLVTANTVSASVAAASGNTGNAAVVASVVSPKGVNRQYVFAETIEIKATTDGEEGGGATAGAENLSITGEVSDTDQLNWSYPDGSGASTSMVMVDSTADATGGNLLTNSCFDAAASNVPTNWEVIDGAAGTDILTETSTIYRDEGKSVEFVGTGSSPLSAIVQKFANKGLSGGTTTSLKPNTVYAVNCFLKKSASLVAGAIQLSLVDGTNTVVNDDAGTANSITVAHGSISDSAFGAHNGFFRTPKTLPETGLKIRVRVSTALTSGESVFVDDVAMAEAKECYVGGPYVCAFRGSTDVIKLDQWNVTIANDYAGIIQTMFDRLFDMRNKGLQLATGSPTIADSLVG